MQKEGFIRKYIFSIDHKVIGLQYGITSLLFLVLGFLLVLVMRWQLAYPGEPVPFMKGILGGSGVLLPEVYNSFGAMHGTVMVFLAVVPLLVGAFGNYLVPLQIGAQDMAFPRLNMASYWVYFCGGVVMVVSFFVPGGAAQAGWTSYPPLSQFMPMGQTLWLLGMVFLITSSLLGSINTIVTILQLRAPGMTFMRMPYFIWTQLVSAFLLLLAFPPLEAAGLLQLSDRLLGTSFFLPSGLVVDGSVVEAAGGGSPLLWQHLFWFLGHPEVYVLVLPAFGIIACVISAHIRKEIWGYRLLVKSALLMGFLAMIVWAHHMFLTGMATVMSSFFQMTTMLVSIPSVINLTALLLSLWGAKIRFSTPMLFALAFLPMFAIGGLSGLPLGLALSDIYLHDTYYVIGHFHYVVAPGTLFAIFAGIYFWFPKFKGVKMNEFWGKIHFWGSFIGMNGVFFPMFLVGLRGVSRRLFDGGETYEFAAPVLKLNEVSTWFAIFLGLVQIVFIINFFVTLFKKVDKEKVDRNPWEATTLEWTNAPSPPLGHGNYDKWPITVYNEDSQYGEGVGNDGRDYLPQSEEKKS